MTERTIEALETALNGIVRDPSSEYVRGVVARSLRRIVSSATTQQSPLDGELVAAAIVTNDRTWSKQPF